MSVDLDKILEKLLAIRPEKPGTSAGLTKEEVYYLCSTARPIFLSQPCLLELKPPITICGDVHGQFHDLLRIFEIAKYPPETNFLFLGDYVDRGKQGIETICLLLIFKIKYKDNFFMLRGNHECSYINRLYGFYDECKNQFGDINVWENFGKLFECLPIAAIVENKIFCIHGGISPSLTSLDDIRKLPRPLEIPEDGLLCDLVWSDPNPEVETWEENERGTGFCFGLQQVDDFLNKFDLDLICRAHQAVMGGYEFPFLPNQGLITLFSAPNYCYEYDNKGAILKVDENLFCSFSVLEPIEWEEEYVIGPRPGTPPRAGVADQAKEISLVKESESCPSEKYESFEASEKYPEKLESVNDTSPEVTDDFRESMENQEEGEAEKDRPNDLADTLD
jgi:serine/threonine-protein phosphatase PP1 catalytic subunit